MDDHNSDRWWCKQFGGLEFEPCLKHQLPQDQRNCAVRSVLITNMGDQYNDGKIKNNLWSLCQTEANLLSIDWLIDWLIDL